MIGSIVISLLALACLGRRWAFAVSLAALMLSYGGWATLERSAEDVRTRSYFGIYEVSQRYDGTRAGADPRHHPARHPESDARPGDACRPLIMPAAPASASRSPTPTRCTAPHPRIGVVGLGTGTLVLLRPARPGLDLLRDRSGDGRGRAQPLHLPQPLRAAGPDRARRRAAQPRRASRANSIDMLAVDAFSSDAVPMHLLTREALAVYGRAVQPRRHRPLPHLQPLSRSQAGDRRPRRARRLVERDAGICADRARRRC